MNKHWVYLKYINGGYTESNLDRNQSPNTGKSEDEWAIIHWGKMPDQQGPINDDAGNTIQKEIVRLNLKRDQIKSQLTICQCNF